MASGVMTTTTPRTDDIVTSSHRKPTPPRRHSPPSSSPSSSSSSSGVKRKTLRFAENVPHIIGYREASDSEDENEFELSLRLCLAAGDRTPAETDFDEENDRERVELRELTDANTLFNSNYQNFKLPDQAAGFGRSSSGTKSAGAGAGAGAESSGPIKFVIQDSYRQPLDDRFKSESENLKKTRFLFEQKSGNSSRPIISAPTTTNGVVRNTDAIKSKSAKSEPKPIASITIPRVRIQESKRSPPPVLSKPAVLSPKPQVHQANRENSKSKRSTTSAVESSSSPSNAVIPSIDTSPKNKKHEARVKKKLQIGVDKNSSDTTDSAKTNIAKTTVSSTPEILKDEIVVREQRTDMDTVSECGSDSGASGCSDIGSHSSTDARSHTPSPSASGSLDCEVSFAPLTDVSLDSASESMDYHQSNVVVPPETSEIKSLESDRNDSPSISLAIEEQVGILEPVVSETVKSQQPNDIVVVEGNKSDSRNDSTSTVVFIPAESQDQKEDAATKEEEEVTKDIKERKEETKFGGENDASPMNDNQLISESRSASTFTALQHNQNSIINNNKTTISISYRRSASQLSSPSPPSLDIDTGATKIDDEAESAESGSAKRNKMLAKLAIDLRQNRSDSDPSLSSNGSIRSSQSSGCSSSSQHRRKSGTHQNSLTGNERTVRVGQRSWSPKVSDTPKVSQQLIEDCMSDQDSIRIHRSQSSSSSLSSDSSNSAEDESDCDQSDYEIEQQQQQQRPSFGQTSNSNYRKHEIRRSISQDDAEDDEDCSLDSSSKHSKSGGGDKKVSALFRNVNKNRYTKLMKKNLSKTSRFIVATTKQIGNDTQDMMRKLKNVDSPKGGGSPGTIGADDAVVDSHQNLAKSKKSKYEFSPNAHQPDNDDGLIANRKGSKGFDAASKAMRNAFRSIEGKVFKNGAKSANSARRTSLSSAGDYSPSSSSSSRFGTCDDSASNSSPSLLKIKRLDSVAVVEPMNNQIDARPTALPPLPPLPPKKHKQTMHLTDSKSLPFVGASMIVVEKPNLAIKKDKNYEICNVSAAADLLETPPPQAPVRRKKLARNREQLRDECKQQNDSITQSQSSSPHHRRKLHNLLRERNELNLINLERDFEAYLNVEHLIDHDLPLLDQVRIVDELKKSSSGCDCTISRCEQRVDEQPTIETNLLMLSSSTMMYATCYDRFPPAQASSDHQPEPHYQRLLPGRWNKLMRIESFCEQYLYCGSSTAATKLCKLARSKIVDSLLLQLHWILANLQSRHRARTLADAGDTLIGVAFDRNHHIDDDDNNPSLSTICDVLLLLPTKSIANDDENSTETLRKEKSKQDDDDDKNEDENDDDSLTMMQAFCFQVFLIRFTSIITNEDGRWRCENEDDHQLRHYRDLVRRTRNGFSSLRDLYLFCAIDVLQVCGDDSNPPLSDTKSVDQQIDEWFQRAHQNSLTDFYDQHHHGGDTDSIAFAFNRRPCETRNMLQYMRIIFVNRAAANRGASIDLLRKQCEF